MSAANRCHLSLSLSLSLSLYVCECVSVPPPFRNCPAVDGIQGCCSGCVGSPLNATAAISPLANGTLYTTPLRFIIIVIVISRTTGAEIDAASSSARNRRAPLVTWSDAAFLVEDGRDTFSLSSLLSLSVSLFLAARPDAGRLCVPPPTTTTTTPVAAPPREPDGRGAAVGFARRAISKKSPAHERAGTTAENNSTRRRSLQIDTCDEC